MTLEQEFKKETGLDAYILNDLRGHIAIDTYVEWLEKKVDANHCLLHELRQMYLNVDNNGEPKASIKEILDLWDRVGKELQIDAPSQTLEI